MPEPTTIAVAVVEQAGQYLIGLRETGAALAGYWEFPGGKVRADETPADAAVRECQEETGLRVAVDHLHAIVDHQYDHGHLRLHFFACRPTGSVDSIAERFRWVAADKLPTYRFPPANVGLIELLLQANQDSAD